MWQNITEKNRREFNQLATHPLQSFEWGEFREKTGITIVRRGYFVKGKLTQIIQLTIHTIPYTKWTIGYMPKGITPTPQMTKELKNIGQEFHCIFMQIEPNEKYNKMIENKIQQLGFTPSAHPLFTRYSFQLDLTKSPEEFLKQMSQKTRYNIRVAIKHDVLVRERYTDEDFASYLALMQETTRRQGFFAHTKKYHTLMWETLKTEGGKIKTSTEKNKLEAHLFIAYFQKQPLTTWVVFTFHNELYYPYGASSSQHRETMSSNMMMWEVMMYGKKMGLKLFDMWGALGPNPDTRDPWFGFHRFKQGYGPTLVEFVGSYDLIINPLLYQGFKIADKLRWLLLRLRK